MPVSLLRKLKLLEKKKQTDEIDQNWSTSSTSCVANDLTNSNSELYNFFDPKSTSQHAEAFFYSLALEPVEIRRERIVLITEAYTIFGALFLAGMYNLWEFGMAGPMDGLAIGSDNLNAIFATIMGIGLIANMFLTMFAAIWWQMSILWSGSNDNFTYSSIKALTYCLRSLFLVLGCVVLASVLALYGNLRGNKLGLLISEIFLGFWIVSGLYCTSDLMSREVPFELNKSTWWIKSVFAFSYITQKKRENMKASGNARREELLSRVSREILFHDIGKDVVTGDTGPSDSTSSIKLLLKRAANNVGKEKEDITPIAIRLEKEWFNDTASLRGVNVNTLARFMPYILALELNKLAKSIKKSSSSVVLRRQQGSYSLVEDVHDISDAEVDNKIFEENECYDEDWEQHKHVEVYNKNSKEKECYNEEWKHHDHDIEEGLRKNLGGKAGALF